MMIGEGLTDRNINVEIVIEIKLLGIFYTNSVDQVSSKNWEHIKTSMIVQIISKVSENRKTAFSRKITWNLLVLRYVEQT